MKLKDIYQDYIYFYELHELFEGTDITRYMYRLHSEDGIVSREFRILFYYESNEKLVNFRNLELEKFIEP